MAKQKTSSAAGQLRSFDGLLKGRAKSVQELARAIRAIVYEELPDAQESFYGGRHAMALYRTSADVCWIQPLNGRCNLYFVRGRELTDDGGFLEGTSKQNRHVKIRSLEQLRRLPVRAWLQQSVALNRRAVGSGLSFEQALAKVRAICLALPQTKETMTWGKPHFRVGEKIFCGCGEQRGRPSIGLKMEPAESRLLMTVPGVEKAAYSRPNDGWVQIDPGVFDDWDDIQRLIIGSYRLIAPKRLLAKKMKAGETGTQRSEPATVAQSFGIFTAGPEGRGGGGGPW
jgi:predicted DNA-binding protein (MmcQ/YjbR family)